MYKQDFVSLNLAWIEKCFKVEPQDVHMLEDVEDFRRRGAEAFFAAEGNKAIATCMVTPVGDGVWEICKLACDERHQGKGVGSAVLEACQAYAREHGARRLMIVTNTVLAAAVHLYRKHGFREVPITNPEYERVNIQLGRDA